jgi:hypothetical protein
MVVISRLASRSDRDGLYKMLRVNRPKVSKKDNKEAKEVIKSNKDKESSKKE